MSIAQEERLAEALAGAERLTCLAEDVSVDQVRDIYAKFHQRMTRALIEVVALERGTPEHYHPIAADARDRLNIASITIRQILRVRTRLVLKADSIDRICQALERLAQ